MFECNQPKLLKALSYTTLMAASFWPEQCDLKPGSQSLLHLQCLTGQLATR